MSYLQFIFAFLVVCRNDICAIEKFLVVLNWLEFVSFVLFSCYFNNSISRYDKGFLAKRIFFIFISVAVVFTFGLWER